MHGGLLGDFCVTGKVARLWGVEYQLIEECDIHSSKKRDVNSSHEVLQVFAIASKV